MTASEPNPARMRHSCFPLGTVPAHHLPIEFRLLPAIPIAVAAPAIAGLVEILDRRLPNPSKSRDLGVRSKALDTRWPSSACWPEHPAFFGHSGSWGLPSMDE
jgi:hypothetical protein